MSEKKSGRKESQKRSREESEDDVRKGHPEKSSRTEGPLREDRRDRRSTRRHSNRRRDGSSSSERSRKHRSRKKKQRRHHSTSSSDSEEVSRHRKEKKKKRLSISPCGALTNQWGRYGVIQECDRFAKKPEFCLWLTEVKHVVFEEIRPWEEKILFSEFMEDYNTATLPHKKYYDLAKWEKVEFAKQVPSVTSQMFDDESQRLREIQKLRDRRKLDEARSAVEDIRADAMKISAMKKRNLLEDQMKVLFKMGRIEESQKIRDRLKVDPEDR